MGGNALPCFVLNGLSWLFIRKLWKLHISIITCFVSAIPRWDFAEKLQTTRKIEEEAPVEITREMDLEKAANLRREKERSATSMGLAF